MAAMAKAARAGQLGDLGDFFLHRFGAFDFESVEQRLPTETFEGERTLTVGSKTVHLKQVGPAHTQGDVIVHVPADRTVFTGESPWMKVIPSSGLGLWGTASGCEHILACDPAVVVPGHGPDRRRRCCRHGLSSLHPGRGPAAFRCGAQLRRGGAGDQLLRLQQLGRLRAHRGESGHPLSGVPGRSPAPMYRPSLGS